ncbi:MULTISPECIES: Crp/Fnr family transcriptional regulator [Desulfitobacterium]|uniref:cAMP-binding protein n=1 Tax=Desulfitobacterium dehalogenans (strain ATCC 51507 / DSM 9161 / JW/IU-DC1) TaxID=756499 RepID=I4AD35_DESDJ|nr:MULTISPECIES: Crp/Fnr family transcriptional regulator [Desulfitobacterium]AFM01870.1 cAMP-binding protein [Desulfitobacterium dehalogenans ATCC 51507]
MKECINNPFCQSLDLKTRERLCAHATITYQKAKQIQVVNPENANLEIIVKGVLFTFTISEDGSQEGIQLVKKGEILGTHLLFERLQFPVTHTLSLTDVIRCNFPIHFIEKLFNENREFAQALMKNLTLDHTNNLSHWAFLRSKSGPEKVAFIYKSLQKLDVDMNLITQEDLALITGVSRITVARAMKDIYKK